MKTSRLLLLAAFVAFVIPPFRVLSATTDPAALGNRYVDLLVKGDFAGAVARHDATMRTAMPEPKLRETWQTLEKQAGQFKNDLKHARSKSEAMMSRLLRAILRRLSWM